MGDRHDPPADLDEAVQRLGSVRSAYTRGLMTNLANPKIVVALTAMIAAFIWALDARPQLQLDVTRDRTLYRENMQGQIENMYRLKLINKTQQPRRYALALDGGPFELQGPREISLAPGEIADLPVSVALLDNARDFSHELRFEVSDLAEPDSRVSTPSTFVAPIAALRQ